MRPRGNRIAIIEDEPAVLEQLQQVLEAEGYHVLALLHPDLIPSIAGMLPLDLLLVDLRVLGGNGLQLVKELRADGFHETPMVAVSASPQLLQDAVESGVFQGSLPKPFDLAMLLDTVEQHLKVTSV